MKKQKISVVGSVLTVEYPSIGKKFTADLAEYPASIQLDGYYHGMKQRFGDAESGKSPQEKYTMVQRIHENLLQGIWELTATPDHSGIIKEAVARIKKVKVETIDKALAKLDLEAAEAAVKEWGSNVKVKAEIAKIRAERAAVAAEDDDTELDISFK